MFDWPLWQHELIALQWCVVIGAALIAAITDVQSGRISNRLTGPLWIGGLIWATWVGGPLGLAESAAACVVLALPFVLLFVFAGGGAGDAKLMGAIGAWTGMAGGLIALASVALAGGALALVFALTQRRARVMFANMTAMTTNLMVTIASPRKDREERPLAIVSMDEMQTMPYGVAILTGVVVASLVVFSCV